jgi:Phosphomannose isomerase
MSEDLRVPLTFVPVYKDNLWGGCRIPEKYHRSGTPEVCAESWEISAHPAGVGVVDGGPFSGRRLDDLAKEYGAALTGTKAPNPGSFPLLFKIIDARQALSVQVHPNNANAAATGGEPKTEMWVVLDRTPEAKLYAGLKRGVTPEKLRGALADGTVDRQLVELPVEPGQALFIPGGMMHAIGAGCLIYEVQQSSNTTYRVFDWNRVGTDGKPRQLHVEESFKTIDWSLPPPQMITPESGTLEGRNRWFPVVACDYFTLRKLELNEPLTVKQDGSSFTAFFVVSGSVELSSGGETVGLGAGRSALVPAAAAEFSLRPASGSVEVLVTRL